jgi:hypothetical protein
MSPLHWVATELGRFLGDGYREIRALIASNTPHSLKKVFTGSLAALVLALLAVVAIAFQIHPAAVILAVACVLLIVYGRTLFRRLALFTGYFLCGFVLFIGVGLITTVPLEKGYPLLAKAVAVVLFVVLCFVIPALLSMRQRQEIAAGGGTWASSDVHLKTPTLTFADVGGLEESKKQIRDLVQANLNGKKFGEYGVFRNGILLHGPGAGKRSWRRQCGNWAEVLLQSASGGVAKTSVTRKELIFREARHRPALLFIERLTPWGPRQQLGRRMTRVGPLGIQPYTTPVDGV